MTSTNNDELVSSTAFKKRHYNAYLVMVIIYMGLGSSCFGFSGSVVSTTLGQPSFFAAMHLDTNPHAAAVIGAIVGIWYAGGAIGAMVNGWVANRWGRKASIAMGALMIVVSGAFLTGSVHVGMYIVFRFFNGWGAYQIVAAVPLWIGEISPPAHRGMLSEIHVVMVDVGYTLTGFIAVGFYFVGGGNQWRGPTGLQMVAPTVLLLGLYKLPESPRWLVMKDRGEEALAILKRLHSTGHAQSNEFAETEYQQIHGQVEFDRHHAATYWEIFTKPSYRKRAIFTIFLSWCIAGCGVLVINNYGALIYSSLGYGHVEVLTLLASWTGGAIVCAFIAMAVVDRVSRTRLIAFGFFSCAVVLSILAALNRYYVGVENPSKSGLAATVAMTFVYLPGYIVGLEGPQFFYIAELWPTHIRAKGISIAMATNAIANMVWLLAAPTAFANIHWRYFLVFVAHCVVGGVSVLLFYPDTLHKPLEEVAALFGDVDEVVTWQSAAAVAHVTDHPKNEGQEVHVETLT